MITYDEAHEWFKYDPETGILTWRKRKAYCNKIGDEAGVTPSDKGYKTVLFSGKGYKVHRIAWLMTYADWPDAIDHINRVTTDNRICNLRSITNAQNMQNQIRRNNKWLPGVTHKKQGFVAQISVDGKGMYLGTFREEMQAHLAYMEAKEKYHKYWNKE